MTNKARLKTWELFEKEWTFKGIPCGIATQEETAQKCGYVQLPLATRDKYEDYDDPAILALDVHGGITYGPDEKGWIGFDTAHAGDYWATLKTGIKSYDDFREKLFGGDSIIEWNDEMIQQETERLAAQVSGMAGD